MTVSVVVPFASDDPTRRRARDYVRAWWESNGFEVVEGSCDEPWRKAVAVADAVRRSDGEILVVADADVVINDPFVIDEAVAAVRDQAPWVMPHGKVHRLDPTATEAVYAGIHPAETVRRTQSPYQGWAGGGIVVVARHTWNDIPMDPRFVGWSGEDESWAAALTTLSGPVVRFDRPLYHLFHQPQPRMSRRWGSTAARSLARRYSAARGEPDQMRALVAEAKQALLEETPA